MNEPLSAFFEGTVRTATPLAFAALGEAVVERAGIINIGLEGAMIAGALAGMAAAIAGGDVWTGFAGAAAAGLAVGFLFALFTIALRADQIITGTAISMLALGATGSLYRAFYEKDAANLLATPTLLPAPLPLLADIPVIGPALFAQPPITYALYLLAPAVWWWMYRSHTGLALRAAGEHPPAVTAAGLSLSRLQLAAVLFGSTMGGIAGGVLVLAQAGTFAEGMSAGRGFIAIAIVVLGRWHPLGAVAAALLFGAASALQFFLQAMGTTLPYQLFLAFPYVLTLVALAVARGQTSAPAALAQRQSSSD